MRMIRETSHSGHVKVHVRWRLALQIWLVALLPGLADDVWEQAPIRYSETLASDPATLLAKDLADGRVRLKATTPLERVKEILTLLKVPEESQILVFSKTSKQNSLITPWNPRALFFSENAYVGYVPGGDLEIISHDPVLGPVFHLVDLGNEKNGPRMVRNTGQCLSCHGTARTLDVPGVLVRSVYPDADGRPLLEHGGFEVDATTPLEKRWGGYYVTGNSSLPHLGNEKFTAGSPPDDPQPAPGMDTVVGKVDASKYPKATSDIVALLVLEHQCKVYNLMTAASYRYKRASWMAKAFNANADPDQGSAGSMADQDAIAIADALLFKEAATLGDGVEGDESFQETFTKRFPKTKEGDSLAEFHLGSKLFMNRCSYMVYSQTFESLPPRIRKAVATRLHSILEAPEPKPGYEYLQKPERDRIIAILKETWPAYRL